MNKSNYTYSNIRLNEFNLRKALREQGFLLHRGRDAVGCIGYRIVNIINNSIVAGEHFEMSLYDVMQFARE